MSRREVVTLIILILISIWLVADENAMGPVLKDIMAEYHVDEQAVGVVGSSFTVLGAIVSIAFGYFSDRYHRKGLLAFVVLLGEIPCFLTGLRFFTPTYGSLLFLRILTGLGVGGIFPIIYSLTGDYFDEKRRGTAIALIGTALGIGQMLGQVLAGYITTAYGWRLPFILAAVPNFVLVPLFLLVAKEPRRGGAEAELRGLAEMGIEYDEKIKLRDLKAVFSNKTNILGFIQGIPGSIPWGLIPFFMVPFYQGKGFDKGFGTTLFLVLGVGSTIGGLIGGWVGDRIYRRSPRSLPVFCAAAVALGIIPGYFLMYLNFPTTGGLAVVLPMAFAVLTGMVVSIPGPNIKAMLLDVNPPEHRGSVFGVHNITDSIGRGIGPVIGGMLIRSHGYMYAMLFSVFMWIPCAILYGAMALTINKDIASLKTYLRDKKEKLTARGAAMSEGA